MQHREDGSDVAKCSQCGRDMPEAPCTPATVFGVPVHWVCVECFREMCRPPPVRPVTPYSPEVN